MKRDYVLMSLNNLKKRGLRSWLTMLGIFIGIAAVVALISLGQGLQGAITGQFSQLDPDKLVVQNAQTGFGPPGSTAVQKLNDDDVEIVEGIDGVDVVVKRLVRVVSVEYNDIRKFNYVANIPEDSEEVEVIYDSLNVEVSSGRLLEKNDRKKVVLGSDFTGESFGKPIEIGRTIEIQGESFEVVGILERGESFQVNSVVLMPEEDLRRILEIEDDIHDLIVVQVQDKDELSEVSEKLENAIRDDRNLDEGEEDFSVQTPEQSIQTINTILVVVNLIVGGIAAISLFVGGVGITNTMYTSVLERTKEIGVMKAVGARNRDVLSLFIVESAFLGLVGGVIGAIIGMILALGVAFAVNSAFPGLSFGINMSIPLIAVAILFSLVIGTFSGLFPALQASKMKPVDAFRK